MVVLGRVLAPFGIHGWVKIQPFGDDALSWRSMSAWWLGTEPESLRPEDWREHKLLAVRGHGKGLIAALEGIGDRTAAEAVEGYYVAAPREALPRLGRDEYYWADLVGLKVIGKGNVLLGVVRSLIETGAHDVLEVVDGEIERLIPFVAAYVGRVDLSRGEIHVDWEADW